MPGTTRRSFLSQVGRGALGLAGAAPFSCVRKAPPEREKPLNFVFILIDDLGWSDLGCYGSAYYETPNIDRLASLGMKFTSGYAASPVCSPTRAAFLTGKYPARLQITFVVPNRGPVRGMVPPEASKGLPLEEVTIAERLKQAGYTSASVGKWHVGPKPLYPEQQGFDINVGGADFGMVRDFFYPGWKESSPGQEASGRGGVAVEGDAGEYLPDRLSQEAAKFIEANKDQPFFLYLAHYAVHTPTQGKGPLIAKYTRKGRSDMPQNNPIYAAMVQSVDDSVGRVMTQLEKLGIDDRTVVFFTSDNGGLHRTTSHTGPWPPTSNAPLREGKGYLHEGGIRVPLIVRWPGVVEAGSVSDAPVSTIDFYPTMLEIAGLAPDPTHQVDGVSFVPLLRQTGGLPRDALYWHFPHYIFRMTPSGAVRQGDYKLIEFFEDGHLELYDLREDLSEENDLAAKMPEKAQELHKLLIDWRESVNAGMPVPNPEYQPPTASRDYGSSCGSMSFEPKC